ncbi:hypothetical protein ACOBQB_09610 [Streptomyces sp. G5(2025)]
MNVLDAHTEAVGSRPTGSGRTTPREYDATSGRTGLPVEEER